MYDELKLKFGYLGNVNHKEVTVLDIFKILKAARSPEDYRAGLMAVNLFYNFGVRLRHRELATRLVAAAMASRVEEEAVELIKLNGTWLEHPPERAVIYATMRHFLDAGQPMVVREIAKAVREDWRINLEAPLYAYTVEALLQLDEDPIAEAMEVYADARTMGVRLPARVHAMLLDKSLEAFEAARTAASAGGGAAEEEASDAAEEGSNQDAADKEGEDDTSVGASAEVSEEALGHLRTALRAADGLALDGYLRGGGGAASLCSVAWLFYHLAESIPQAARDSLLAAGEPWGAQQLLGGSWVRAAEAAAENFGCHWGFSASLPRGFFRALEASANPEAARLVASSREHFGRFYPGEG